uniref:MRG domain-containing protein n=1 Tax=Heterosigma akashiwo TaxID=2829 RepID=A0A6V2RK16_HETAK
MQVCIDIPQELTEHLILDWEMVTKDKKLLPLPRAPSVRKILQNYQKKERFTDFEAKDIMEKLVTCFDGLLGHVLLYRFEREQYEVNMNKEGSLPPVDIYGAEHLLRLLTALPRLVGETGAEALYVGKGGGGGEAQAAAAAAQRAAAAARYLRRLEDVVGGLARYMLEEEQKLFTKKYEAPEPEYSTEIPT